jgi:hypothetical protein
MAYKTFANGFPLPASDLNNFLMNQSVIVFADSAARTSAIPSPVEGMLTYLEDTNAYESWNGSAYVGLGSPITTEGDLITGDAAGVASRIAIGTADQVLTVASGVPTWADPAGGGDVYTLNSSGSVPTGGTSFTVSSIASSSSYILIWNITTSGSSALVTNLYNGSSGGNFFRITNFYQHNAAILQIQGGNSVFGKYEKITQADTTGKALVTGIGGSTSTGGGVQYTGIIEKDDLALSSFGASISFGTITGGSYQIWTV